MIFNINMKLYKWNALLFYPLPSPKKTHMKPFWNPNLKKKMRKGSQYTIPILINFSKYQLKQIKKCLQVSKSVIFLVKKSSFPPKLYSRLTSKSIGFYDTYMYILTTYQNLVDIGWGRKPTILKILFAIPFKKISASLRSAKYLTHSLKRRANIPWFVLL